MLHASLKSNQSLKVTNLHFRIQSISSFHLNDKQYRTPEMVTLRAHKLLRNIVGQGNILPEKCYERITIPVTVSVLLFSVPAMGAVLFGVALTSHNDLVEISDSIVSFLGFSSLFWCYCHLLVNRNGFYLLFGNLQNIIHTSEWNIESFSDERHNCNRIGRDQHVNWRLFLFQIFNSRNKGATRNLRRSYGTDQF